MALATSLLDSGAAGAGGSITSASVTPTAGSRATLWVTNADTDGTAETPTISGTGWASGLTWTQQATLSRVALGGDARLTCWTAVVGGSPTAGTVTATAAGQEAWGQLLVEVTDTDTPTVEQVATDNSAGSTSFSVTLTTPDAAHAAIVGFAQYSNSSSITAHTAGTDYTLYDEFSVSAGNAWMSGEYDLTAPTDGVADITSNAGGSDWLGIALEIGDNAGGGGGIAPHMTHYRRLRAA